MENVKRKKNKSAFVFMTFHASRFIPSHFLHYIPGKIFNDLILRLKRRQQH